MILPTLKREKKLWKRGYENIVGLDEVGRGSLAGPLVAAGVIIVKGLKSLRLGSFDRAQDKSGQAKVKNQVKSQNFFNLIRDSKSLNWRQREEVFKRLVDCDWLNWACGVVEVREVEALGVGEASREAMRRALWQLGIEPDFLLIDAVKIPEYKNNSESIIKGDMTVFSIACASIMAKVTRDQMMRELAREYPYWGFDRHKGYGTLFHLEMIERYGVSKVHRRSFGPVKNSLESKISLDSAQDK